MIYMRPAVSNPEELIKLHALPRRRLKTKLAMSSIVAISLVPAALLISESSQASSPAAINLGSSSSFAILAKTYVTTGANSTINGDIGAGAAITTGAGSAHEGSLYAGAAITTGANNAIYGNLYALAAITNGAGTSVEGSQSSSQTIVRSSVTGAMTALDSAIADASGRTATVVSSAPALDGNTLTPGVHSAATAGFLTLAGTLTLDAEGDPSAVFIMRGPTYITTAADSSINLVNGAQASNVFWVTGSYFVMGARATLQGNILASGYVSLGADTAVQGRIFSQNSYVLFGASGPSYSFGVVGIGTTVTPASAALTPTFSDPTPTADGFTLNITNFSDSYGWSGTATNGGIVTINSSGLVTVTGLAASTSANVTITSTKTGSTSGSETVSATSSAEAETGSTAGSKTVSATSSAEAEAAALAQGKKDAALAKAQADALVVAQDKKDAALAQAQADALVVAQENEEAAVAKAQADALAQAQADALAQENEDAAVARADDSVKHVAVNVVADRVADDAVNVVADRVEDDAMNAVSSAVSAISAAANSALNSISAISSALK